jgi:hypothetical protein
MTLALPLLLFTMALMVGLGAAATWKVRTLVAARNTAWRHRYPRGGPFELLRAPGWPSPASFNIRGAGNLSAIDHPAFQPPIANVIRGPMPELTVNANLFDPTRGLIEGEASHRRLPPLLPSLGQYSHDVDHLLLDDRFQFSQMGIPSNVWRRIAFLYGFDDLLLLQKPDAAPALKQQYLQAVQQTTHRWSQPDMWILDRDPELLAWGLNPDFHPRLPSFCSLDVQHVRMTIVAPHLERIYGWHNPSRPRRQYDVPLSMAQRFISLYRLQIQVLYPPPQMPPQHLLDKIQKLQDFQQQLQAPL